MTRTWLLTAARRGLGVYLALYGIAALCTNDTRIPVSAVDQFAPMIGLAPHVLLGLLFLLPGIGCLASAYPRRAMAIAVLILSVFTVGLIHSVIFLHGTVTAPITYAFITVFAAFVLAQHDSVAP